MTLHKCQGHGNVMAMSWQCRGNVNLSIVKQSNTLFHCKAKEVLIMFNVNI